MEKQSRSLQLEFYIPESPPVTIKRVGNNVTVQAGDEILATMLFDHDTSGFHHSVCHIEIKSGYRHNPDESARKPMNKG